MKKAILSVLTWSLPFLLLAQSDTSHGINWTQNLTWEQIKEKAKQEQKFIFVDAYTTWCGPCKKMDEEVYPAKQLGEIVNPQFISVRIQMDRTDKDNDQVKNWYSLAKKMNDEYTIEGYPSFLFFNPDGKLVHKALGFRNVSAFIEVIRDALTDPEGRYKKLVDDFKNRVLDFQSMPKLAGDARQRKNNQLSLEIAKKFKEDYLDKLGDEDAFKKENLSFIVDFSWDLMKSSDRYFKLFYTQKLLADSILNQKISGQITYNIIRKEEIVDKIYKDNKAITKPKPNWEKLKKNITSKYGERYMDNFFPDDQIRYYGIAKDWKNYVKFVDIKIKKYPPQVGGKAFGRMFGDAWDLNSYAWRLFLHCSDPRQLNKALGWVDLAIKLDTAAHNFQYYDTKANLLYRLNRVKEAIEIEEIAVKRSKSREDVVENFTKMKNGLPTWQVPDKTKN